MARVLKLALTAFALQKACALDLAAETDLEEKDALGHRAYLDVQELSGHGHRAYLDVTVGAVSAGAHAAEVQELSGHGHRAYLDVTVGAVSAGAHAAEVQELSGHGHRAYLDVTWPRPQGVLGRHRWGGQRGGLGLGHGGARCGRSPQGGPQACARAWFASGASRGCRQHGLRPARRQVVLGSSRQHVPGGAERLHD
ncbi:unnamed protein product [Prorocentrum cordatum]|uniref:Uncharacterized protein n=1 Tax=Prorocentrum cordatum TaxID=2364126 RepID=A0ABN9QWG7_9DINO|nr:unnamed protein product [Polarella glacialis]